MEGLEAFREATTARIGPDADPWLASLDGFVETLRSQWRLVFGGAYPRGAIGWTIKATRDEAEPVVLKVSYPDGWFQEETAALAAWDGRGVVRLLASDPNGAQLLERAEPGTPLLEEPDEDRALDLAAGVLEELWIDDPGGITSVAEEAVEWARTMPGRLHLAGGPLERSLVDAAAALIRDLAPSQPEQRLLHGDLHLGNVLAADREPWLAIDPKPLVGERAFDVTALIRDKQEDLVADPLDGRRTVQRRFDRLSERFGLDRERLKGWSVAVMTDYALWCFEVGDRGCGERQAQVARMLQDLRV
jgi:streptomycin 6-kinase